MPVPTFLDIGLIFAFLSLILLFLAEYFSYSKSKFSLLIDINKTRKLAILFGIIFVVFATIYIALQILIV